jgi:cyanate permease
MTAVAHSPTGREPASAAREANWTDVVEICSFAARFRELAGAVLSVVAEILDEPYVTLTAVGVIGLVPVVAERGR